MKNEPNDLDNLIRARVLERARALLGTLIGRLQIAESDLATGSNRGVLGGLDGIERDIATIRSLLLLLP